MMRVARSFISKPDAAEEVVQETWLAVLKGLQAFEGRSSLKTWIFHILANRTRECLPCPRDIADGGPFPDSGRRVSRKG